MPGACSARARRPRAGDASTATAPPSTVLRCGITPNPPCDGLYAQLARDRAEVRLSLFSRPSLPTRAPVAALDSARSSDVISSLLNCRNRGTRPSRQVADFAERGPPVVTANLQHDANTRLSFASWAVKVLPQKRSPCSTGTFGARAFGIAGSASFTIHSCSAFATGLVDCATNRLKPSSVIVVTDCTLPLVSTMARPRSCSGTSFGTLSVRMPRMRQTSLATIHLRPLLAKMWTDEGLMLAVLKATVVVAWIVVAAMMLLTFDDLDSLDDGRKLFTHWRGFRMLP